MPGCSTFGRTTSTTSGHVPGADHIELGALAAGAERPAGRAAGGDVRPRRTRDGRRQPAGPRRPPQRHRSRRWAAGLGRQERYARWRLAGERYDPTDQHRSRNRAGTAAERRSVQLLVVVNALVGGMLGQERTVLPLLGKQEFGLTAYTAGLSFILAFGIAKAATNYFAGTWMDRFGRKPVLVAGWLVAVPVPFMLIWAPSWTWIIVANVLLGVSQGLTWSTTVVMKIDLVGPARRGLAMGLNEAAGYAAVAATALATGYLAETLRTAPGAVLPRHRLRRARPRVVDPGGQGDPRARPPRGRRPRGPRRRQARPPPRRADQPAGVRADQLQGAGTVLGQPGRPGQQPQRRPGLGSVPDPVRRRRTVGRQDRHPRRRSTRPCGASGSCSPARCPTGGAASG